MRAGRAQIAEAYVILRNGEAYLIGAHVTPLPQTSTHVIADSTRTRKLLLHRKQLATLIGKVERAGYTLVPLDLHWNCGRAKLAVGLAKARSSTTNVPTSKTATGNANKAASCVPASATDPSLRGSGRVTLHAHNGDDWLRRRC